MLKERGSIMLMNPDKGMYAVEIETGGHAVFELVNSTSGIEMGDEIIGPLKAIGEQELENVTRTGKLNVHIEGTNLTRSEAKSLLKFK
jgi:hypothetical protein